ncbi:hypothetical protein [Cronobacter malonaticus]|uniref:hypothetical protein n=1 Tax=Cronobacter malonaticus TaxID=413503 RepID=UPI000CFDAED1|nr:hypothetical protein [Cronobacter malonaticus]
MSEISKDERIYRLANHIASSKNGLPDEWQAWADEIESDLRELLALRERAEPVYQLWSSGINQWVECDKGRYEAHAHVPAQRRVLYTAPPAPVVPDALANDIDSNDHPLLWSYNNGWNACRAAMLQPVSQPYKLPEWTNEQCLEFLAVAFRHAEIKGDFDLDDLRLGVKMANAMTSSKEG